MIDKFIRDGWVIVDFNNLAILHLIRNKLEQKTGCRLWEIHNYCNDETTKKNHVILSELFWKEEYSLIVAEVLLPQIQQLIGLDVMVQYMPYLRISRPRRSQDNIGYHKDTQYGQTPYELAVHLPFVNLDDGSAIKVISGSHIMPESAFSLVTPEGPRIEKGSIENHMGKPYAPKCLKVPDGMKTTPLTMKIGQCAIFSPAIFHGQEVNEGDVTRVSCDLRFVSSHHADKVRVGRVHAGYVPVLRSPVEQVAELYFEVQNGN